MVNSANLKPDEVVFQKDVDMTLVQTDLETKMVSSKSREKFRLGKKALFILLPFGLILVGLGIAGLLTYNQVKAVQTEALKLQEVGQELKTSFGEQNFEAVFAGVKKLEEPVVNLRTAYEKLSFWKAVPWFNRFYRDGGYFLVAGEEGYAALVTTASALEPYQDLLIPAEESDEAQDDEAMTVEERLIMVLDTLDLLEPQFDEIVGHLKLSREAIEQIDSSRYPETFLGYSVRENVVTVQLLIASTARSVEEVRPLLSYLKPLLGIPEEKTYFLLFQNDTELRPSGGFMTAYSYLSVKDGKFTPLGSYDIYALDAQFGNRVKAPESIQAYLPNVDYWHLRDMNLSPDFVESMKTFWENYEKIPGAKEVDGIIAVDTQFLVDILEVLGPIGVSGWGEFSAEIDSRCNCPQVVYELELFADQPVSRIRENRKGVIGPLMYSILSNTMGSPRAKWPEFFNIFFENVAGKHILFYFFDSELQAAVEKMNAAGRITETTGDYFHLNDCNFGGAKSNLFITRQVVHEIKTGEDGYLVKKVTVDYRNPAPASDCNLERGNLCLNSFYRNWFRLYVPAGSELIEAKGSEVEIKTYEEFGKTVFEGFYGFTPGSSLKPEGILTLEFTYRLPFKTAEIDQYRLLIQKQPGTKPFEHEVIFEGQTQIIELKADTQLVF